VPQATYTSSASSWAISLWPATAHRGGHLASLLLQQLLALPRHLRRHRAGLALRDQAEGVWNAATRAAAEVLIGKTLTPFPMAAERFA